jgi:hypothetical protein
MVAAMALVAVLALLPLQVCRDWAFVCENAGSQKGYRQWFTGHRTGQWYQESHLERFMEEQHPGMLQHQWVSCSGTGKNILGQAILFGHGRPAQAVMLDLAAFDRYVDSLDDVGKLSLYQTLASGQHSEIEAHMEKVLVNCYTGAGPGLSPD